MFGGTGSDVGAAGGRAVGGRGDALLDSALVDGDLGGGYTVDLTLVVEVAVLEVDFVVFAVGALHHVVVVHCGVVLHPAAQALGREDLLLGADDVDALLRLVDLVLEQLQEAAVG